MFEREQNRVPVAIGRLYIRLDHVPAQYDPDTGDEIEPASKSAQYEFTVIYSDGSTKRKAGNLVPHITTAQREALLNFVDSLRAQAEQQVLPEEVT